MERLIASPGVACFGGLCLVAACIAGPAVAAPDEGAKAPPIQLTDMAGKPVKQLFVRDSYTGYDVLDPSHVLLRTPHHEFFVVTFEKPCDWMDFVPAFQFTPEIGGWVRETDLIDARSYKGAPCYVTRLQQVASANDGRALAKKTAG
jgi:hypothetical protein